MKIGERDRLGYLHPIEATLAQLGINVRDPNYIREMHFYLELLREEIRMTEEFLIGCDEPGEVAIETNNYRGECARLKTENIKFGNALRAVRDALEEVRETL